MVGGCGDGRVLVGGASSESAHGCFIVEAMGKGSCVSVYSK